MVAALGGAVVQSAPREYVRDLFDGYAATFDQHLVNELDYRTPELIANLVHDLRQVAPRSLDVLDLGCGTGLAGAAISPFARRIVGVDLAPKMLEVAQRKGIYERLECNDLLDMLAGEQSATFDLVLATDVFIYLGRLDRVVAEVWRVLRPGGLFAFSVERLDASDTALPSDVDFRVTVKGRYAHSAEYLRRLSIQAGFAVDRQVESALRMDQGRPIAGWLAVWSVRRRAGFTQL
jgi:predicted TPR repeat methyltransferase